MTDPYTEAVVAAVRSMSKASPKLPPACAVLGGLASCQQLISVSAANRMIHIQEMIRVSPVIGTPESFTELNWLMLEKASSPLPSSMKML